MKASLLSDLKTRWRPVYRRRRTINTCQSLMKASLAKFRIAMFITTPSDGRTCTVMLCDTWPNNGEDFFCVWVLQFKYVFRDDNAIISGWWPRTCILYSQRAVLVVQDYYDRVCTESIQYTAYWQRNYKRSGISEPEWIEDSTKCLYRKQLMFIIKSHWSI